MQQKLNLGPVGYGTDYLTFQHDDDSFQRYKEVMNSVYIFCVK